MFTPEEGGEERIVQIDTIMWCSGYHQYYPFLDPRDNFISVVQNRYASPIWKHLWCANEPDFMV